MGWEGGKAKQRSERVFFGNFKTFDPSATEIYCSDQEVLHVQCTFQRPQIKCPFCQEVSNFRTQEQNNQLIGKVMNGLTKDIRIQHFFANLLN